MKNKFSINLMTEIAIFASIGYVLDLIQGIYSDAFLFLGNGGSIGISMCACFVICFRRGPWGMITALIIGLLDMIDGVYISPLANIWYKQIFQVFLDYFGAWTLTGVAGVFCYLIKKNEGIKRYVFIIAACFTGSFFKYICHVLSGFLFWPNSDASSALIYSISYNALYMFPSFILCTITMFLIVRLQPKYFLKID